MAQKAEEGQRDDGATTSKTRPVRLWQTARQQEETGRVGKN